MKMNRIKLLICGICLSSIMVMAQNVDPYMDDVYYSVKDAKKDRAKQQKAQAEYEKRVQEMYRVRQQHSVVNVPEYGTGISENEDAIDAYNGRKSPQTRDSILRTRATVDELRNQNLQNQNAQIQSNNAPYQSGYDNGNHYGQKKRRVYGTYSDRLRRFHSADAVIVDANCVYIVDDHGNLIDYADYYGYNNYYDPYYDNGYGSVNIYINNWGWSGYYNSWYPWYSYPPYHPRYYGSRWGLRYDPWYGSWYDPWYDPYWYRPYYGGYYGYYGWGGYYGGYNNGYWNGYNDGYFNKHYYRRSQTSMSRDRYRGNDYGNTYTNNNGNTARSGWNGEVRNGNVQSSGVNANGSRGQYNGGGVDYSRRGSWNNTNNNNGVVRMQDTNAERTNGNADVIRREGFDGSRRGSWSNGGNIEPQHGTIDSRRNAVRNITPDINTSERAAYNREGIRGNSRGSYVNRNTYNSGNGNHSYCSEPNRRSINTYSQPSQSTRSYSEPTRSSSSSRGSYSSGSNSSSGNSSSSGSSRGSYGGRR